MTPDRRAPNDAAGPSSVTGRGSARTAGSLRADARRNRARVLEAAQAAFAAEGLSVPLDEIARRAAVGAGTVYRHFPTKEALFEAVVLDRLRGLVEEAHGLATADDPTGAFFGFLSRMVEEGAGKKDLVDALAGAGIDVTAALTEISRDLRGAVAQLLARAQDAGAVRRDVGIAELMAVLAGTIVALQRHGGDAGVRDRVVSIFRDGLRAGSA
ncbi:MAG TPA: TetR/AcrR family transcriptional regulator [Actinomycetes bacterium]